MASRWTLTLTDDEPQVLPERTDVDVMPSGVLHLATWSETGDRCTESYIAPHAWVEVHRGDA